MQQQKTSECKERIQRAEAMIKLLEVIGSLLRSIKIILLESGNT